MDRKYAENAAIRRSGAFFCRNDGEAGWAHRNDPLFKGFPGEKRPTYNMLVLN